VVNNGCNWVSAVANLGFEVRVGQGLIFFPSSTVATVVGGAKSDFCANSGMSYHWFNS
jgi:hypothetical protein